MNFLDGLSRRDFLQMSAAGFFAWLVLVPPGCDKPVEEVPFSIEISNANAFISGDGGATWRYLPNATGTAFDENGIEYETHQAHRNWSIAK